MKIAHCIFSFQTGGAETMLIDIANEQIKTQQVTVIIVNNLHQPELIEFFDKRVEIIFIGRTPQSRSILPLLRFNRILHRLRPDIIHLHNYQLPRIISPFIPAKIFLTVHDLYIPLKHIGRKINLIAISVAVKEDIFKHNRNKVVTIPNGINLEQIERRNNSSIFPVGKMRIVQVARLHAEKKGQDILIEAMALLKKRGIENIEVDFIGTGSDEKRLKDLAESLGVTSQIHFLGLQNRTYIYSHLKEYDLMCHPARYEGFGLTVAEGIAAMLPVLVSDEGGPYEIIKRGELGYSFRSEDATDCADKIEHIYKNYNEALAYTRPAYEYTLQNYSVNRMVMEYIQAYQS